MQYGVKHLVAVQCRICTLCTQCTMYKCTLCNAGQSGKREVGGFLDALDPSLDGCSTTQRAALGGRMIIRIWIRAGYVGDVMFPVRHFLGSFICQFAAEEADCAEFGGRGRGPTKGVGKYSRTVDKSIDDHGDGDDKKIASQVLMTEQKTRASEGATLATTATTPLNLHFALSK